MIITVVDRNITLEKHKGTVDFHCWLTEEMCQCASTFCAITVLGQCTCFRCKQSCRQASAGSSHQCRWARQSERTHVSTAGCHCRQWICPPCWAPGLGWSLSGFGSFLPAGGSCADGYCGGHFPTAHSYKNTHQRQETNIKSYLVPLVIYKDFWQSVMQLMSLWVKSKGIFPTSF